jgi:hypothetical protein
MSAMDWGFRFKLPIFNHSEGACRWRSRHKGNPDKEGLRIASQRLRRRPTFNGRWAAATITTGRHSTQSGERNGGLEAACTMSRGAGGGRSHLGALCPGSRRDACRLGAGGQMGGVITAPVVSATINDRLSAIGTGRALRSVQVTPFTSGRLTEILVRSGAWLRPATSSPGSIRRPRRSPSTVPRSPWRTPRQAAAAGIAAGLQHRHHRAGQRGRTGGAQCRTRPARRGTGAGAALHRLAHRRRRRHHFGLGGNYVTSQTEIATVDDRSQILIDFWVPERFPR